MLLSVRYMHFSNLAHILNPSILQIRVLFFRFYALHSPSSHSQQSLLRVWFRLVSSGFILQVLLSLSAVIIAYPSSILLYLCISRVCLSLSTVIIAHLSSILLVFSLHRPCYHCQQWSMLIQASFCSFLHCIDLALTLNGQFCKSELYSVVCMHCTNLAVTLRSECCSSKLHFTNSCIAQTLLLLSVVIDAHPRSILLFLCIALTLLSLSTVKLARPCSIRLLLFISQTWLSLPTVIVAHLSPILLILCIAQPLLSLWIVIIGHPDSIFLFLCIPQSLFAFLMVLLANIYTS